MSDVIAQMGPSFLGSRLKRLGERLQASACEVIAAHDLPLQPAHMPALAALRSGPMTIGQIAEATGLSQPGVTRIIGQLAKLGYVEGRRSDDLRERLTALTSSGEEAVSLISNVIWPGLARAVGELVSDPVEAFMAQIDGIESALAERSLAQRVSKPAPRKLILREYSPELAREFHDINAEWISSMFTMEKTDLEVLENPEDKILAPGGAILFVECEGLGIVGTCALQRTGNGSVELTKMGVRETARGLKAGEFLLAAVVDRAKALGADPLYLLTNRKCESAIHLYEKLGFRHDREIMANYGARYERCDVAMRFAG